ncbi:MAG: hypothetical protein RBU30_20965 [Polyangia bacterium]|nr:hypothetical protein [Polyangia bacterium]
MLAFCPCLAAAGCVPPSPMGLILPGPQKPGTVILQAQAAGGYGRYGDEGYGIRYGGGGVLHLETFATSRISLPLSLSIGRLWDASMPRLLAEDSQAWKYYGTLRMGVRYRVGDSLSVGGGVGGSAYRGKLSFDDLWDEEDPAPSVSGGCAHLDFEWSRSKRHGDLIIAFSHRLVWDASFLLTFHMPAELTLALSPRGSRFALTLSVFVVWTLPAVFWGGSSLGLVLRI